jgi:signal transduction histidine kinase
MKFKNQILLFPLILLFFHSISQPTHLDSLKNQLKSTVGNEKIILLITIADSISQKNPDEAIKYLDEALKKSEKTNITKEQEAKIYNLLGASYYYNKNYRKSLKNYEKELEIIKKTGTKEDLMESYFNLGLISQNVTFGHEARDFFQKSLEVATELQDHDVMLLNLKALYEYTYTKGKYEDAFDYFQKYSNFRDSLNNQKKQAEISILRNLRKMTEFELIKRKNLLTKKDSALYETELKKQELQKETDAKKIEIEVLSQDKKMLIDFQTAQRKLLELEKKQVENQKILIFSLVFILLFFILFMYIIVHQFKLKKRAYKQLYFQNIEIAKQAKQLVQNNKELEDKNEEIKRNQQLLVQQEKLASLGLLTAGIAHEIRNPLNFIKNFAQLSVELTPEIKEIINSEENNLKPDNFSELNELSEMLINNTQKIVEHSNRADSIISGMLNHANDRQGTFEPVDINNLVDQYFKLAFHGAKGEMNGFDALIKTNYDKNIGIVHIKPTDFGRVILNIVNNACYAMNEKKINGKPNYQPELSITTQEIDNRIEIIIKDNGTGLPEEMRDKIFQPFFTTKPAGKGTGLGLSISYEIITQGHSGRISVNCKEGQYTEFHISIPKK